MRSEKEIRDKLFAIMTNSVNPNDSKEPIIKGISIGILDWVLNDFSVTREVQSFID